MKKYFYLLSILLLLSCENKQQTERIQILRDSIAALTDEVNHYKMSPDKLGHDLDAYFAKGNIKELQKTDSLLKKYHPESVEARKADSLVAKYYADKKAKAEAERQAKLAALNSLRKTYDDVADKTWYHNSYFTHTQISNRASIYIGQEGKKGDPWIILMMSYTGSDWIFFDSAYLSYDGKTLEIPFDKYREYESESGYGGRVWEWIQVRVDSSMLQFLRKMVEGKEVKMRLSGKYTETRALTNEEINAFKQVLAGYDLLLDPKNR